MGFKGFDHRRGKMAMETSCFDPPSFRPALRPYAQLLGAGLSGGLQAEAGVRRGFQRKRNHC